jgi:hypothetical protein
LTKDFGGRIALRYVPPAWRATNIVFITKPSKNGLKTRTLGLSAVRLSY